MCRKLEKWDPLMGSLPRNKKIVKFGVYRLCSLDVRRAYASHALPPARSPARRVPPATRGRDTLPRLIWPISEKYIAWWMEGGCRESRARPSFPVSIRYTRAVWGFRLKGFAESMAFTEMLCCKLLSIVLHKSFVVYMIWWKYPMSSWMEGSWMPLPRRLIPAQYFTFHFKEINFKAYSSHLSYFLISLMLQIPH